MIKAPQLNGISDFNGIKIHNEAIIRPSDKMLLQPIALSCGVKFNEHVPMVTYGNFMCIVGASKSMKSFLKTTLLACYIGGNAQNLFPEIHGHSTKERFIIDLDTEQSDYHVHRASKRIVEMVGTNYPYYRMFALRSITPKERVQFIEWLYKESEYRNQIGLMSVDGVADLLDNVNDLDKSNEITQMLMTLTKENNSAMITVLHRNFESDKPTGHLGSAILKKSETVAFVDKKDDVVEVKARYTRNIPFDNFSFMVDNFGIPKQMDSIF